MKNTILIGLDGGATKIRGGILETDWAGSSPMVRDCLSQSEIVYSDLPEYDPCFQPIALDVQLKQFKENALELSTLEKKQGNAFIEAAVQVVRQLAKGFPDASFMIGIGMPGLKTADKKGIGVMANGPRIPHYISRLTQAILEMGIRLQSPIERLGSDADYCGIGEKYSELGKLRDVSNACYLGIGTGVADAMVLDGNLLAFDQAREWIAKSWEMLSRSGLSFEKCVSMPAIARRYLEKCGGASQEIHAGIVFENAFTGEARAQEVLDEVSIDLAQLIFDRIYTLAEGGTTAAIANPNRPPLLADHSFRGKHWERIVLGLRLGDLWEKYFSIFGKNVCQCLYACLKALPASVQSFYLEGESIRPGLLVSSSLENAPLIGAGLDAYRSYHEKEAQ